MKKILLVTAIVAALGAAYAYYARPDRDPTKTPVAAAPAEIAVGKGALRVTIESTGRVVANHEVEIKCKASGEVIELPVDVSDAVEKNRVIARLDPVDEKRIVRRAEVSLAVSQARLTQARLSLQIAERELATEKTRAQAALNSAEASARESASRLKRAEELHREKIASREELDNANSQHALAISTLESARARIEDFKIREVQIDSKRQEIKIAEADVEANELALSDARQRLDDTTVTAPIDGVVASRNVQVGQIIASGTTNVGGGTSIMTLVDLGKIFVLVSVDESDIGRIEIGQRARITVDAYPDAFFPGEVVRVATKGVNVSNVVTFEVKVEIKGRQRMLLKPEMTANVEITAIEKDDILLVPLTAIRRSRTEKTVTVIADGGATEERTVETGASDGEFIEILNGLTEGEKIMPQKPGADSRWRPDDQRRGRIGIPMMPGGGGRRGR